MGCTQRVISCLELTIVRQELGNSSIYLSGISLLFQPRTHVFGTGESANAVSEDSFAKFHKIIWKTMVTEYFLNNVAEPKLIQPENLTWKKTL